ncbi:hypothetical protein Q8A73_017932 [Channa argus]|nr:hypothetical protein Q8A73_017932 [Channa argus]
MKAAAVVQRCSKLTNVKFGAESGRPPADPSKLRVFGVKLQLCLIYWLLCLGPNLQPLTQCTRWITRSGRSVRVCVCGTYSSSLSAANWSLIRPSYISAGLTSLL